MFKPNVDKMYTYLRAYLTGAQLPEAVRALQYARDKHKDQTRKNGEPYIIHPLSMACYAVALGIRDADIISTILLHDVVEDCGIEVEALPFNDNIKRGVKYMTVTTFDSDQSKSETKHRYFKELLESREACVCKAIDRYNNLASMPFALSDDAIGKNVAETELMLMPVLKEAKEKWNDLSDVLFVLRTNISSVASILRLHHKESYEKWCKVFEVKGK